MQGGGATAACFDVFATAGHSDINMEYSHKVGEVLTLRHRPQLLAWCSALK